MDHIGEWMPIQNSTKIRREPQSARDLSQTSEEDFGSRHLRTWRQSSDNRIANDGVGRDASQQKRRRRQTRRADHDIGLCGEPWEIVLPEIVFPDISLQEISPEEIRRDLHLNSVGPQLRCEPA